jgi:hypothetical protein
MSGVTGRQANIAFAICNTWGTAASVTKGIYFQSDGGLKFDPEIIEDDSFGQVFISNAEVGNIKAPKPKYSATAKFDDYSYIWEAQAMGSPTAVAISTSAVGQTTSWTHQFDLANSTDGLALTTAIDRVLYVEELTSAKIHGWDLEDGTGGMMKQTYDVTGSKPTIQSSVNITATVTGAVYPALGTRVMMKHGTFRMNRNSLGALASTDAVKAEKVKFGFSVPIDAPNVYGQDFVDEPASNGFPAITLEITYPRMNTVSANSLYAGLRDSQTFKADWTFLGANINSTDAYKVLYQFPYLQLTDFETPLSGAKQIKPKAKFTARLAPTSPTGMAFVRPFRLTRTMTQSLVAF